MAHLLNLNVKLLFSDKKIAPLLSKYRSLVGTFKHSSVLSAKLTEFIRVSGQLINDEPLFLDEEIVDDVVNEKVESREINKSPSKKSKNQKTKLIQDMVTRWNSTLSMLVRLFEFAGSIRAVINGMPCKTTREEDLRKKYQQELLNYDDLEVIEDLISLIKPFQTLTVMISASDYVTCSIILPAVTRLKECLMLYEPKNQSTLHSHLKDLAHRMHDDLDKRSESYFSNSLLIASTFLDPRYRSLSFIKDSDLRSRAFFNASIYIKSICNKYK